VVQTPDGYIIFDDTTLEKKHAEQIALAKHQYSGNAQKVVNGIGVVTCVYVNPTLDRSWLIDYRIYDKQGDGKTKLDHVEDMLGVLVGVRNVAFSTVLMDSWYASKRLLLYIESLKKTYYCPMKSNRLVDDSQGEKPYQRIDALHWTVSEKTVGKVVKLHKFPKHHKVKVFRVASSRRTDYKAHHPMTNIQRTRVLFVKANQAELKPVSKHRTIIKISEKPNSITTFPLNLANLMCFNPTITYCILIFA